MLHRRRLLWSKIFSWTVSEHLHAFYIQNISLSLILLFTLSPSIPRIWDWVDRLRERERERERVKGELVRMFHKCRTRKKRHLRRCGIGGGTRARRNVIEEWCLWDVSQKSSHVHLPMVLHAFFLSLVCSRCCTTGGRRFSRGTL